MTDDKRCHPIGIFDSGIGGLTVMQAIRHILPNENIIYLGDSANVPYGDKSPSTILHYSITNSFFLLEKDIKLLVIACNTASAFALERLKHFLKVPVIGVIDPAIDLVDTTRKIAVLGTKATIASGAYHQRLLQRFPEAEVASIACPLFVPLVEERFVDHPAAKLIVKEYLAPIMHENHPDTALLGCTHYPLLKNAIQDTLGPGVRLIDSAHACALEVQRSLHTNDIYNLQGPGSSLYYTSGDPQRFKEQGEHFLKAPIDKVMKAQL
ncbi:MAG: glutamate racemase [Chlamydiota bacterium]